MRFDGYIRVSDTKGRSGERFLSPDIQRDTIERLAAAKGVKLGEVVEELDVSGGQKIEDRELGRLVERVERGESAGVIVWNFKRFSRNMLDAVETTIRIRDAGGRLIAEDFDSAQPMGKAMLGLLAGLAEEELDARREGWRQARKRSVERGVPNGRAPFGYCKLEDGRLAIVKADAKIVEKVFKQRAAGVAFSQIARERGWSHSTTRQILANVAYRGVARSGEFVKEDAHPAIISRDLWNAAQTGRVRQGAPPGETTKDRLLLGIARCAGCGKSLKVVRRKRADGSFVVSYFCKDAASERCPDRAFVHAEELDGFVAAWFEEALASAPRMIDVVSAGRELEQAQAAQFEAEAQLHAYIENADALDKALFQRGLSARQDRVNPARERVRQLSARLTRIPAGGTLSDLWRDFDALERRDVLCGFLGTVRVARGASSDLPAHVSIVWSDGTSADDEARIAVAAA
jgi:DNA invertase Pin-like site-specific DNA recombinase